MRKGFRCPKCGQGERMISVDDGTVFVQNEAMDRVSASTNEKENDWTVVSELTVSEEILYECKKCQMQEPSTEWVKAFEQPMDYFDADNLCRCGGEYWLDRLVGTQQYVFKCEKCDHIKPQTMVSGGAGNW